MNEQKQPSQETLNRYAQRRLSDEEEAIVELWLMDHPEMTERLQLDAMLQNAFHVIRPAIPKNTISGRFDWFLKPRLFVRPALASLAALTLSVGGFFLGARMTSLDDGSDVRTNIPVVYLENMRSGPSQPDGHLKLTPNARVAYFQIDVGMKELSAEYSVSITAFDSTKTLEKVDELVPALEGFLSFMLPTDHLKPGQYTVTVTSAEGDPIKLLLDVELPDA